MSEQRIDADEPEREAPKKQAPRKQDSVASPCVSICALDDDDICIGCHRSGDEISQWGAQNNAWKRDVLKKAQERWRAGQEK